MTPWSVRGRFALEQLSGAPPPLCASTMRPRARVGLLLLAAVLAARLTATGSGIHLALLPSHPHLSPHLSNTPPLPSPAPLFYLHRLRSCALSPWGAVSGSGQCCLDCGLLEGIAFFLLPLIRGLLVRAARLITQQGAGVLLLVFGSVLWPSWSSTPFGIAGLLAKFLHFHRPRPQCRLLTLLLSFLLVRRWSSRFLQLFFLLWAGANPLFPQEAMEVDALLSGSLPDAPQVRPADALIVSSPDIQQSSWWKFPSWLWIVLAPPRFKDTC